MRNKTVTVDNRTTGYYYQIKNCIFKTDKKVLRRIELNKSHDPNDILTVRIETLSPKRESNIYFRNNGKWVNNKEFFEVKK